MKPIRVLLSAIILFLLTKNVSTYSEEFSNSVVYHDPGYPTGWITAGAVEELAGFLISHLLRDRNAGHGTYSCPVASKWRNQT